MHIATGKTRIVLSYEGATFTRTFVYISLALIGLLIVKFIKFPTPPPPPGAVAGPPIADLVIGFLAAAFLICGILDFLFVLQYKYFHKKIECDQDNLYVTDKNGESTTPLKQVNSILLTTAGSQGVRGISRVYLIQYEGNDGAKQMRLAVYVKMRDNFGLFKEWVKQKNPSVEIKNWATSLDGLSR